MAGQRITLRFKTGPLSGKTYSLGPGEYGFIGSAENCAIRITDDPMVDPQHAAIYFDPSGKIMFKDMGSKTGSFVNGKRLTKPIVLKAGDRVTIGQFNTFQSSWWNALQVTRLTRFSMIRSKSPTPIKTYSTKTHLLVGSLVSAALVAGAIGSEVYFSGVNPDIVFDDTEKPTLKKDKGTTKPASSLSAKLFQGKSKKSSKPRIDLTPEREFIWDEIVAISRRFGDPPPTALDPGFIIEVEKQIDRFTRGGYHRVLLTRKAEYATLIEKTLINKGLPAELGYIVWVESNYKLDARSPVGAAGLWQFMPETAKEYGLKVGGGIDERLNPIKATNAAADYFTTLLRMFGSERYLLAIASYNTGQNRVLRHQIATTVSKEQTSDFWHIRLALPKETYEYVPKVMAAIIIGRNPTRYDPASH